MFDVEGEEWEGKYEIRPNPFLKQRDPNLWMDNFMLYNIPGKEDGVEPKERIKTQGQETTKGSEGNDPLEECVGEKKNQKRYVYPTVFSILAMNIIAISPKVVWWHLQRMKMVKKMWYLKLKK